jgi:hypothetical protein
MINIASSIVIYRPLNLVFDFISSADNDFQWQYGTLASAQVTEGAAGVGTSVRSIGHLMGRRMNSTFEVTEFEANRKYGFKSLSGPLHSHTLYTLDIADGCTRINVSQQASPANVLEVAEGILEKYMKKQLREDLAMLKTVLEAA